ncbi:hypothetical protein, partial [Escherichia coli]
YYRSILPSNENNIRLNYSTNNISLIPVEAIFANCPHETVTGYKYEKGKVLPLSQGLGLMQNYIGLLANT